MVRAWYMDASGADQRLPHWAAECEDVSLEELSKLGVEYWTVNVWCSYIHNLMVVSVRVKLAGWVRIDNQCA